MYIVGSAPFRISFYGGGTDIEPYPSEFEGCCISHSISIGCFASIDLNADKKIIENLNFKTKYIFENNKKNDNLFKIFNLSKKNFNYHLKYFFELNTGSGLGSSGSFIGLLSSFINKIEGKNFSKHRIANKAFYYEKKILRTSGGRQDEFASVFGGFNFLQFKRKNITSVKRLQPSFKFKKELQKKSLLVFTGMNRDGSKIIDSHIKIYKKKKNIDILHEIKNLTLDAKNYVRKNDIENFILKINKYWDLKKQFNPNVTNSKIDKLIDIAKKNGAHSAKLLGAGNGGHLLIFCEEIDKKRMLKKLEKLGCSVRDFSYQESGLNIS
jgi:D-glycero-alpha-D-manno-heptose-7-phosphate kinase